MKNMKSGISLVTLFIMTLILVILATTTTVSGINALNRAKLTKFASELGQIQNLVDSYKEANSGEYPVGDTAVLDISGLTTVSKMQFADETKINSTKINLFVIDMSLLSKTDLTYGNKKTDKDIYVVSKETGKVYYAEGFKANGKTYYTLTTDLFDVVDYDESLKAMNKDGILFYVTNTNWTNKTVDAIVKIPDNIKVYNNITVVTKVGTQTLQNISLSATRSGYKIYNIKNIDKNCDIVVNYKKEGTAGNLTQTYSITNIDKVAPILELVKEEGMVNSDQNDKKIYIKVNVNDGESGINFCKYETDEIDQNIAKEYFVSGGFSVKDNTITVDRYTGVVTVFAQDKAGNSTYKKIELDTVIATEKDYVQEGLLIQFDGINNTGAGHSNLVTTWKNLASSNYDGILQNYTSPSSSWTNNSLKFNGIDNWVKVGRLDLSNFTVEAVIKHSKASDYEKNMVGTGHDGGYGLFSFKNKNGIYVGLKRSEGEATDETNSDFYHYVYSKDKFIVNKVYSLSGSYNGSVINFFENNNKTSAKYSIDFNNPEYNTIVILGADPIDGGMDTSGFTNDTRFDGEIMSIRIYNRALSEEEVRQNYRVDKIRFKIK